MVTAYYERASVGTATTGTVTTLTLSSAVTNYQALEGAGVSTEAAGVELYYVITEGDDWETCAGLFISSAGTITRRTIESSNSDAAITLLGAATISFQVHARDIDPSDDWGNITDTAGIHEDYGSV